MTHTPVIEFKAIIDSLAAQYPNARVDFRFPKNRAGKKSSELGEMTQFSLLRSSPGMEVVRISINYARPERSEAVEEALP